MQDGADSKVKIQGVYFYKEADKILQTEPIKGLLADGKKEAVRAIAMVMYDKSSPEEESFSFIRAALSVWRSIGDFAKNYVKSPLVRDEPKVLEAINIVKLATCPLEINYDNKVFHNTGWKRNIFPELRARRQNPRAHKHSSGLMRKIRKARSDTTARLGRKVEAYEFWVRKTSPMNLGAGKKCLVSACDDMITC